MLAGLPARLRSLRLHLGLTEREMAARVGVSVGSWRRRERTPPTRRASMGLALFLVRLGEEFDVSIDWVIFGARGGMPTNDLRPLG